MECVCPTERPPSGRPPTSATTALSVTLWCLGSLASQRGIAERFPITQGHSSMLVEDEKM